MKLLKTHIIAVLLCIITFGVSASETRPALKLEDLLDLLFRKEMLLTVAGIKPMSLHEFRIAPGDRSSIKSRAIRAISKLRWAVKNGTIFNPNLGFVFLPVEKNKEGTYVAFWVYNKKALQDLLASHKRSFLSIHGKFEFNSVDDIVQTVMTFPMFHKTLSRKQMYRRDLLFGVVLGYPIDDVREHLAQFYPGFMRTSRRFDHYLDTEIPPPVKPDRLPLSSDFLYDGGFVINYTEAGRKVIEKMNLDATLAQITHMWMVTKGEYSNLQLLNYWDTGKPEFRRPLAENVGRFFSHVVTNCK